MDCSTTAPVPGLLPLDRLDEVDTTLYHMEHICALLGAFAGQPGRKFTDGIPLEHYAVVFGLVGDEIHDARLQMGEVRKWVVQS